MCRWFAYISPDEECLLQDVLIDPTHSLVKQVHGEDRATIFVILAWKDETFGWSIIPCNPFNSRIHFLCTARFGNFFLAAFNLLFYLYSTDHYLPQLFPHDDGSASAEATKAQLNAQNRLLNIDGFGCAWYTVSNLTKQSNSYTLSVWQCSSTQRCCVNRRRAFRPLNQQTFLFYLDLSFIRRPSLLWMINSCILLLVEQLQNAYLLISGEPCFHLAHHERRFLNFGVERTKRYATSTAITTVNNHPFLFFERFSFMHNGSIG